MPPGKSRKTGPACAFAAIGLFTDFRCKAWPDACAAYPRSGRSGHTERRRGEASKDAPMEGFQFLDIIFFAMIAAFLVFRLRGVLGRRTGHQSRPPDNMSPHRQEAEAEGNVIELPDLSAANDEPEFEDDADFEPAGEQDPLARGLARIRAADREFDPAAFETGARRRSRPSSTRSRPPIRGPSARCWTTRSTTTSSRPSASGWKPRRRWKPPSSASSRPKSSRPR